MAKYSPDLTMVQKKRPLKPGDPGFVMEVDRPNLPPPLAPPPATGFKAMASALGQPLQYTPNPGAGWMQDYVGKKGDYAPSGPHAQPVRTNIPAGPIDAPLQLDRAGGINRDNAGMEIGGMVARGLGKAGAAVNRAGMAIGQRVAQALPGIAGGVGAHARAAQDLYGAATGDGTFQGPMPPAPSRAVSPEQAAFRAIPGAIDSAAARIAPDVARYVGDMAANWQPKPKPPLFVNGQTAMEVDRPPPPGAFGGMGEVRMAERAPVVAAPPAAAPLAPDRPTPYDIQNGAVPPPLPFNDRKARQRAQADYQRALHTDKAGPLGSVASEDRIGLIRGREDVRDAYARQNRPLQNVQSPGEIADRHSELGRNLIGGFRSELEGLDQQIKALDAAPLSEDKQRQMELLSAQRANKAAQLEKAMADPYWQQYTPEKAGQIQAGQGQLRSRQMADRTSGAADVAAYQGRERYDRNLEDTIRQRGVAETLAASKAREAESIAAGEIAKRQGLGTSAEQIATQTAAADAEQAAEIRKIQRPLELDAVKVDAAKQQHPEWQNAAQGILSGIKAATGKMISGDARVAYDSMLQAFDTFQTLPPELQRSAAADILSTLAADGLDVPKDAFQDDKFNNVMSWLLDYTTPQGWAAQAAGLSKRPGTRKAQESINAVLGQLRQVQAG